MWLFIRNDRRDHFGDFEDRKADGLGYKLTGRFVSVFVPDPTFRKEGNSVEKSRSAGILTKEIVRLFIFEKKSKIVSLFSASKNRG